jgi:hypothetical protein
MHLWMPFWPCDPWEETVTKKKSWLPFRATSLFGCHVFDGGGPRSRSEPARAANVLGVYGGCGEATVHTARVDHRLLRVDLGPGANENRRRSGFDSRRAIYGVQAIDPGPSSLWLTRLQ